MHIIQKSNILNIKKKTSWKCYASIKEQRYTGYNKSFIMGGVFSQTTVKDVNVAKEQKEKENAS